MSESDGRLRDRVLAAADAFSHCEGLVARHHALDDLIAAVNDWKAVFPLPAGAKGFGWRKPPELPEPDILVLAVFGGCVWTATYRLASEKWLYNRTEVHWQPEAWSYIPEAP